MNKIKNLVPLSEFVDHIDKQTESDSGLAIAEAYNLILRYNKFLSQPLELGFFVPCDDENNVLEEPEEYDYSFYTDKNISVKEEYQQAKSKILFSNWNYCDKSQSVWFKLPKSEWFIGTDDMETSTIEDLVGDGLNLTEQALKHIYG